MSHVRSHDHYTCYVCFRHLLFVITFARLYAEVCAIPFTEQVSSGEKGGWLFHDFMCYRIAVQIMFDQLYHLL